MTLRETLGEIDIYLFDQLLKARLRPPMRVLDVGCGGGRNLVHMLRAGFDVHAVDRSEEAVAAVRALAAALAPALPADRIRRAEADALPYADGAMEAVLAIAVLHFARDLGHFRAMLDECWRVLAPGGLFFARLSSTIGLAQAPRTPHPFVADAALLEAETARLGGRWAEPLKTTVVAGERSMTTWVLHKPT